MAYGHHLAKYKTAISPQRFDRSAQIFGTVTHIALRSIWAIEISNILKRKMADGRLHEK